MSQATPRWKVLVVGLGDIGTHILEVLARTPSIAQVTAVDIADPDEKNRATYSAELGALHHGQVSRMEYTQLDVSNTGETAEFIKSKSPDCVISCTSLLSWWVPQAHLPDEVFRRVDEAGFGPWFPLHFTLLHHLMLAVREAAPGVPVVNCSYPDATNASLARIGLAPAIGVGNCDLFFPRFRLIAADHFAGSPEDADVYFVGDHYMAHVLNQFQSASGVPYYLKILYKNNDVTDELAAAFGDMDTLLVEANRHMPRGAADHFLVAASAVKNVVGLLEGGDRIEYSPGPCGLPGGYPVRFSGGAVEVVLPEDISLDDAVRINQDAGKGDGVDSIRDDGTVVLTEKAHSIMQEELGFSVREYEPWECEEHARALLDCFWRLVRTHGAHQPEADGA